MKSIHGFMTILCLVLSGSVASAADEMKADPSAGERIGGQAGLRYPQEKQQSVADPSAGERIGGQAGLRHPQEKQQSVADPSAGERIGGQARLKGE